MKPVKVNSLSSQLNADIVKIERGDLTPKQGLENLVSSTFPNSTVLQTMRKNGFNKQDKMYIVTSIIGDYLSYAQINTVASIVDHKNFLMGLNGIIRGEMSSLLLPNTGAASLKTPVLKDVATYYSKASGSITNAGMLVSFDNDYSDELNRIRNQAIQMTLVRDFISVSPKYDAYKFEQDFKMWFEAQHVAPNPNTKPRIVPVGEFEFSAAKALVSMTPGRMVVDNRFMLNITGLATDKTAKTVMEIQATFKKLDAIVAIGKKAVLQVSDNTNNSAIGGVAVAKHVENLFSAVSSHLNKINFNESTKNGWVKVPELAPIIDATDKFVEIMTDGKLGLKRVFNATNVSPLIRLLNKGGGHQIPNNTNPHLVAQKAKAKEVEKLLMYVKKGGDAQIAVNDIVGKNIMSPQEIKLEIDKYTNDYNLFQICESVKKAIAQAPVYQQKNNVPTPPPVHNQHNRNYSHNYTKAKYPNKYAPKGHNHRPTGGIPTPPPVAPNNGTTYGTTYGNTTGYDGGVYTNPTPSYTEKQYSTTDYGNYVGLDREQLANDGIIMPKGPIYVTP